MVIFGPLEDWTTKLCWFSILYANWAENQKYMLQNWDTFKTSEKISSTKSNQKFPFWIRQTSASSALFQRKSASKQRWFLAVKIFVFSAAQRFLGNEQRCVRTEIFPRIRADQRWMSQRYQPGLVNGRFIAEKYPIKWSSKLFKRVSRKRVNHWNPGSLQFYC